MTARKEITILCDVERCGQEFFSGARDMAHARQAAKAAGWRYITYHLAGGPGRDLCPKHAEGALS